MLSREEILELFSKRGTIIEGHFVYRDGKHGNVYVDKDTIYPHKDIRELCDNLVVWFNIPLLRSPTQAVVAPATGGIILSRVLADCLIECQRREVLAIYARKHRDNKQFVLKKLYRELIKGKKVLLADDVLNTGATLKELAEITRDAGAEVIGAAVLINRGTISAEQLGIPQLVDLIKLKFDSWNAQDCLLCQQGIPINQEFGRGRETAVEQVFHEMSEKSKGTGLRILFDEEDKDA